MAEEKKLIQGSSQSRIDYFRELYYADSRENIRQGFRETADRYSSELSEFNRIKEEEELKKIQEAEWKKQNPLYKRAARGTRDLAYGFISGLTEPFYQGPKAMVENRYKKKFYDNANKSFEKANSFPEGSREREIYLKEFENLSKIADNYSQNEMKSDEKLGELTPGRIAAMSLDAGFTAASLVTMGGPAAGFKGALTMSKTQAAVASQKFMGGSKIMKGVFDLLGFGERPGIGGTVISSIAQAPLSGTVTAVADKEFAESEDKVGYIIDNIAGSALVSLGIGLGFRALGAGINKLTGGNKAGGVDAPTKAGIEGEDLSTKPASATESPLNSGKEGVKTDDIEALFRQDGKEVHPVRSVTPGIDFNEVIRRSDDQDIADKIQRVIDDFEMLNGNMVDGGVYDIDFTNPETQKILKEYMEPLKNALKVNYEAPPLPESLSKRESTISFSQKKSGGGKSTTTSPSAQTSISAELPKDLKFAKPTYKGGYMPIFANDIDKAAYIVGKTRGTKSKRYDDYKAFLEENGVSVETARELHKKIVTQLGEMSSSVNPYNKKAPNKKSTPLQMPAIYTDGSQVSGVTAESLLGNKRIKINFPSPVDQALNAANGKTKADAIKYLQEVKGWDEATIKTKRKDLLAKTKEKIQAELDNC
jgi:hypothetical protein